MLATDVFHVPPSTLELTLSHADFIELLAYYEMKNAEDDGPSPEEVLRAYVEDRQKNNP